MEDMQNQQPADATPRRRRAVRSVPMGGGTSSQSAEPAAQKKAVSVTPDTSAVFPDEHVSAASAEPIAETAKVEQTVLSDASTPTEMPLTPSVSEPTKELTKDLTEEPTEVLPGEPQTLQAPASQGGEQRLFEDTDSFAAIKTFSSDEPPSAHRTRVPLAVLGVIAVLLAVCIAAILPFMQKSEAVMLYIDETAVGYVVGGQDVDAALNAVLDDLRQDTALPFEAQVPYRCENASVQGTVALLSSDAIYDVMYAQATEGYVRAYRLFAQDGSINYAFGVMTEAEILSAVDAAIVICCEQYASGLPSDAVISAAPCFAWETAWIAEDAVLDTDALISRIVDAQKTDSAMLSVAATLTETEAQRIPYETTYVPNDENYDGIRSMISPGADGLAQVTYTVELDPATGTILSRTEANRVVVREPISAVSYEGKYPLPDGVSTGTFAWPLPPLPDDELPLDDHGNPYVPENPLALKNTYVSSGYGDRILWGEHDFHLGLDIVAPAYTEIYAADGGVVVFAAYTSSYGYMTRILHANNVETVYAHQIKQAVKPGDVVQKGQLIGYVGSTGNTSGNHLHLEFRRDHVTVDPLEYIAIPEDVLVLGEGY